MYVGCEVSMVMSFVMAPDFSLRHCHHTDGGKGIKYTSATMIWISHIIMMYTKEQNKN